MSEMKCYSCILFVGWFVVQAHISGYRDMARFWIKGTWPLEWKAGWLPYWTVEDTSNKTDPFHFAGGLLWLLTILLLFTEAVYHFATGELLLLCPLFILGMEWYLLVATVVVHVILFWMFFYWIRNIMMHVSGIASPYKKLKYLIPPPILWVMGIFNKRGKK